MPVVAADPERVSAEGALRGVLSFGYFSLHKQRKVTRVSGSCCFDALRNSGFRRDIDRQAEHLSRLKPLLQVPLVRHAKIKQQQQLSPCGELLFFARAKKSNQKKARPASRPPRCALRVRVHRGDPRKGHPAPAADGVHPCTPPFGFFPAMAAASEGNPVRQQQQQSNDQSNSDSNSNSKFEISNSNSKFEISNSNSNDTNNSGADNAPLQ
ncbi:hypothetical protein [Xanthomonas sacchari]|uniref:hypothetical protein n=1 Tax=Xanthomonas sacchari TaxID=56458 RepID=UPI0011B05407|nr:hypothetical protein [Xanthomonas sacchari]